MIYCYLLRRPTLNDTLTVLSLRRAIHLPPHLQLQHTYTYTHTHAHPHTHPHAPPPPPPHTHTCCMVIYQRLSPPGVYFWFCYAIGTEMGVGPLFLEGLGAEQWQIGLIPSNIRTVFCLIKLNLSSLHFYFRHITGEKL